MNQREPCDIGELRGCFLFERLDDDQLRWLCEHGHVERHPTGLVYREGDPAEHFYVLLEGTLAIRNRVGEDEVETVRTDQKGVYAGATAAYLGERFPQVYRQSLHAVEPCRFYVLSAEDFAELMTEWFPMPVHLLEGLFIGRDRGARRVEQRERLLALGSLSAGLTHELNNPAAAAVRATASLRERVAGMRHKLALIADGAWDQQALPTLVALQERAAEAVAKAPELSAIEASDREDELADWLDRHGVPGGYELAPTFVQAGIDVAWLERVDAAVDGSVLEGAVRWLNYTLESELLMNEISDSANRISALVGAAKQYSQLDRSPQQVLDVHELLESTLVMLSAKIGDSVSVVTDYDRTLPAVQVYGAEMNQVWTNLIDNALQAMGGEGTLTLRTRREADDLVVEVRDTGPGIPEDVVSRIYEPFFTTKAVGEGTGLGLDICWRIVVRKHHGDLSVASVPGDTCFTVRLPLYPTNQQ